MIVTRHGQQLLVDLEDETLFGNDAGEDEEPAVLAAYYLDKTEFKKFWQRSRTLAFARARKGMGKSAMLGKMLYDLGRAEEKPIVIRLDGADLTSLGEFNSTDFAVLINQWRQAMCTRVLHELGKEIPFAYNDAMMTAVEASEIAGFKSKNLVRALIDRMLGGIEIGSDDVGAKLEIKLERSDITNPGEFLRQNIDALSRRAVWLLVDDIDSKFSDNEYDINKVASFISACRKMVRDVKGLHIRATIRTDVWTMISAVEDLDKSEQYMVDLRWTNPEMATMLAKRVRAYLKRANPNANTLAVWYPKTSADELIEVVFQHRLKWGNGRVPPAHVVQILSGRRPRWMTQLCRDAGEQAHSNRLKDSNRDARIGMSDINDIMFEFGKSRIRDLLKEHSHQFADLERVVSLFNRGPNLYSTGQLTDMLYNSYLGHINPAEYPILHSRRIRGPLELARFLFQTGLVQAQLLQRRRPDEFVNFDDRPDLLKDRHNPDDGHLWAIHPSYRSYLRTYTPRAIP